MKNQQSSVRFDHREIAVVFSLFIFVSLLMFTVGILVGKGLQQAKYEGFGGPARTLTHGDHADNHAKPTKEEAHGDGHHADAGTSITTGHGEKETHGDDAHGAKSAKMDDHAAPPKDHHADAHETHAPPKGLIDEGDKHTSTAHADDPSLNPEAAEEPSLDLVPAHPKKDKFAGIDEFPRSKESDRILKDPRMAKYLEGSKPERATASIPGTLPKSYPNGKFTVQVGSYPNQREAQERVEALKKLGFPFAYFSAKEIKEKRQTWYRVGLGFFPDENSARQGGELLQSRGEVTNYIIRKNENEG